MILYTAFILLYFTKTDKELSNFNFQLGLTSSSDPLKFNFQAL